MGMSGIRGLGIDDLRLAIEDWQERRRLRLITVGHRGEGVPPLYPDTASRPCDAMARCPRHETPDGVTTNEPRNRNRTTVFACGFRLIRRVIAGHTAAMKLNASDIAKMSRIERLAAIEALWESLLEEQSGIESPGWHRDILAERERRIAEGKMGFVDLDELKRRLRKATE
jgi:hypothetical protein